MDARDIIISPVITERTTELLEQNKYTFKVALKANKVQIKKAIEEIFGVKVKKVNTMRVPGKRTRRGISYRYGRTPEWKKAIVTLTDDSKPIPIFEGL